MDPEQLERFHQDGFVRIPGAFTRAEAEAMADRVWRTLERKFELERDDANTWDVPVASGLQGLRRDRVFEPIGGTALSEGLDAILGEGSWRPPKDWGQMLVTFPNATEWTVPHRVWHTDFPYVLPTDRVVGALVFSFLSDVPPGTGGTAVVKGSPRVIRNFVERIPRKKLAATKMKFVRRSLMRSDPWLAELDTDHPKPDRVASFVEREGRVGEVPVRVAELSGEAGDIILGHPWLLHSSSDNAGNQPRLMRVQRVRAAAGRVG